MGGPDRVPGRIRGRFSKHCDPRPTAFRPRHAAVLYAETTAKADMARQYNVFGPEVEVAADAALFDRALGLAGRGPSWKP